MEIFRPFGFDKPLFFTTLALILIGLIMVFSSTGVMSTDRYDQPFRFFIQQIIGAGLGLFLVVGILWVRKPFYQNANIIYGLLLLTLFLLALSLIMPAVGNTNRWVLFMGLRFQPSELAKISLNPFFVCHSRMFRVPMTLVSHRVS